MILLARMDRCNKAIQDVWVLPQISCSARFVICEDDECLKQGTLLYCLEALGGFIKRAA